MRILGGLMALALLAGCGGGNGTDTSSSTASGGTYGTPAAKVTAQFKARTGVALQQLDDDAIWTSFVPPAGDAKAIAKYGPFTLYVFKKPGNEDLLLKGASAPDADGIAWKAAGSGQYVGTKRYGENVYVVFSPEQPGRKPGPQFAAIEAALQGL